MNEDPISKSRIGPGMGPGDPIPRSKGGGSILTNRDYAKNFKSLKSRILFLFFCLLPYICICVFVYLEIVESLGVILLAVPLVLLLLFWALKKRLEI